MRILKKEFGVICRVLLNINQNSANKDNSEVDIIETDKGNNELSIANSIIKDYIIHGIYNKSEELVSVNSDNEIHWESTISLVQPVFSKKAPIYPSLYSFDSFTQEDYVITQIHKWSVNFCLKKYGDILFDQKPQFDEGVIANLKEIGAKDYLLHCINKELNEVFVDRNTQLLKLLKSLIEKTFKKETEKMIFGTTSFHVVWEEVYEKSAMLPDILSLSEKRVFTIDAKYYKVKNISGRFEYDSYPSVEDVSKQFLYEQMYEKAVPKETYEAKDFYNIFISPMPAFKAESSAKFFVIIGHVNMKHFDPKKIWVMLLNPKEAYKAYIRKEQKGYESLDRIVTEIDELRGDK